MENINLIKSVLINKNITHYKIIRHIKKQLWYKDLFNTISYDDVFFKKIFVVFKFKNKIGKFTIFDTNNSSKIKKLIDKCLENSQANSYYFCDVFDENPDLNYSKNNIAKEYFENFDITKIIEFLKKILVT